MFGCCSYLGPDDITRLQASSACTRARLIEIESMDWRRGSTNVSPSWAEPTVEEGSNSIIIIIMHPPFIALPTCMQSRPVGLCWPDSLRIGMFGCLQ